MSVALEYQQSQPFRFQLQQHKGWCVWKCANNITVGTRLDSVTSRAENPKPAAITRGARQGMEDWRDGSQLWEYDKCDCTCYEMLGFLFGS